MKPTFKQLIIEFHEETLPKPSHRELKLPQLAHHVRKAIVFVGMRRSGKTWEMYQQMNTLLSQGLPKEQMLYINFEDGRLSEMKVSDFQSILDAYHELYPNLASAENRHFFFDEIHEIEGWEKFIRRLLDTENVQLYLSGSSAKLLSKEIATSLRGRTITREVFPFSFREYLNYKKIDTPKNLTIKHKALLLHHIDHYLQLGGFPEAIGTTDGYHRELLQSYIETVIYRDIVERYHLKNSEMIKRFLNYCLQNSTSSLSINKAYNTYKSQGYSISKNSLYNYLEYFEDTYCLFEVSAYNFSQRKSNTKAKKIYPIDTGLITAYTIKGEFEYASRLETAVFLHLRRTHKNIYYYQDDSTKEVDFLTLDETGAIKLYQACLDLSDQKTKTRELTAMQAAMSTLKLKEGHIITLEDEEQLSINEGTIYIVPLWKFLLSQPD